MFNFKMPHFGCRVVRLAHSDSSFLHSKEGSSGYISWHGPAGSEIGGEPIRQLSGAVIPRRSETQRDIRMGTNNTARSNVGDRMVERVRLVSGGRFLTALENLRSLNTVLVVSSICQRVVPWFGMTKGNLSVALPNVLQKTRLRTWCWSSILG